MSVTNLQEKTIQENTIQYIGYVKQKTKRLLREIQTRKFQDKNDSFKSNILLR